MIEKRKEPEFRISMNPDEIPVRRDSRVSDLYRILEDGVERRLEDASARDEDALLRHVRERRPQPLLFGDDAARGESKLADEAASDRDIECGNFVAALGRVSVSENQTTQSCEQ
jgi:hypothetical protein